jgi:hypothetical protein
LRGHAASLVLPIDLCDPRSGYILHAMERIKIEQHSFMGILWCGAWLFTIGFLHLSFWKGVLAIILWPYYLGVTFSSLLH